MSTEKRPSAVARGTDASEGGWRRGWGPSGTLSKKGGAKVSGGGPGGTRWARLEPSPAGEGGAFRVLLPSLRRPRWAGRQAREATVTPDAQSRCLGTRRPARGHAETSLPGRKCTDIVHALGPR